MTDTLRERGEASVIGLVRRAFRENTPLAVGIGDDCAVFSSPGPIVATADAMVEDVHFRRASCPPEAVGRKLVAVNVSDIAAMGARPTYALFTASFPKDLPWRWVEALVTAMGAAANEWGLTICGGDVTGSPGPISLSLSVLGTPVSRRVLLRSAARPGERVYVTGPLGGSAFGLEVLEGRRTPAAPVPDALARHLTPTPRLAEGTALGLWGQTGACMDLSDGLAQDLPRLASASGVTLVIDLDRLPVHPELLREAPQDAIAIAVGGGEDYELVFTAAKPPPFQAFDIGVVLAGTGEVIWRQDGADTSLSALTAFSHF